MQDETIYKSTPEVKRKVNMNIPFDKLEPGLSVFLHFSECREDSLRSLISTQNSKGDKKFKMVKHKEREYYEVACIMNIKTDPVEAKYKIVQSSEEAKQVKVKTKVKYPFNELPEGLSFILPIEGTSGESLNVQCLTQSKKLKRKFVLLKHESYGMYEVYCVPTKKPEFFQPSAEMLEKVREM